MCEVRSSTVETEGAGPRGRRALLASRKVRSCTRVEKDMMPMGNDGKVGHGEPVGCRVRW